MNGAIHACPGSPSFLLYTPIPTPAAGLSARPHEQKQTIIANLLLYASCTYFGQTPAGTGHANRNSKQ